MTFCKVCNFHVFSLPEELFCDVHHLAHQILLDSVENFNGVVNNKCKNKNN